MKDISARELKGHNILAVERFEDSTRWMIEFVVLHPCSAYGSRGDEMRLFLAEDSYQNEQIDEITEGIAEVQASGGERFTVKQLERTRKSLEARLEKLQAEGRKDDVVTFEQLGVDRLFVDEAHNYKNLFLYTKMRNVAGLSTSDAQKSSDMFAKCRYMDEITGNRGVIFATGTPVSNSMTELYTIRIWEQTRKQRSAQLVFCDLSTPKDDGTFSVYNDLKKKFMEAGILEEEIAFIHDANTEARKKELFSKVRSGQVRILMGSTQKMGAGTNVQDRLIALHDLDCPWRPSDLAQRLGRIVRQGNQNPEVEIFRYVTESTFDAYLYQLVENKQKFIAQIMTSKAPVRVADDVDETALSYSEIKALATGNPLIIEKCNLDMEVGKLNMLRASYLSQKYGLEDMVLKKYPEAITRLTERIVGYEQDMQLAAAHPKPKDGFAGITILEKPYADKEAAGKAILDVCTKMTGSDAVFLGQYRGFSLVLSYDGPSNEYRMTMKGALSHTAVLGADVFGNLTRMDNVVDGLPGKLDIVRAELTDTQVQLENARTELAAPFAKEAELAEKTARLKELNILLNMDEKDKSLIDDVPDDDAPEHHRSRGMER